MKAKERTKSHGFQPRMKLAKLSATMASYGAAMSACDSAGADAALLLLEDMRRERLVASGMIAGSAAGALRDRPRGLALLKEISSSWPDTAGFGSVAKLKAEVLASGPGMLAVMKPAGIRSMWKSCRSMRIRLFSPYMIIWCSLCSFMLFILITVYIAL